MVAELVKTTLIIGFTLGGNRVLTEDSEMIGLGSNHERWCWRCTSVACDLMRGSRGRLSGCRLRHRGGRRRGSSATEYMGG